MENRKNCSNYVEQNIKHMENPYHIKISEMEIILTFSSNGPTMEECIQLFIDELFETKVG